MSPWMRCVFGPLAGRAAVGGWELVSGWTCPPLPAVLGALLVELRDRQDPLLRPVLHRAAQVGWPVAVLAPVLGVSPGALRGHLAAVDGYDLDA